MKRWLSLLILLVACDAELSAVPVPDATAPPDAAPDAPSSVDAPVCAASGPVDAKSVRLEAKAIGKALVLDGNGTRCEQLARAILDPAQRPPELAKLDVSAGLQSPLCAEFAASTNVAIVVTSVLGQPLLSDGQYVHAWIDNATETLAAIRTAFFIEPPPEAPSSCTGEGAILAAVTGHKQAYVSFQTCAAYAEGSWEVRDDDPRSYVRTGLYYDGERLRVVHEVDVEPAAAQVTQLLRDSDLNCFGRIAITLVVDAETREVIDTRRHCIVC